MFNEYLELKNVNNIKYIKINKKCQKKIFLTKLVFFITIFNLLIILLIKDEVVINQIKNCKNEIY